MRLTILRGVNLFQKREMPSKIETLSISSLSLKEQKALPKLLFKVPNAKVGFQSLNTRTLPSELWLLVMKFMRVKDCKVLRNLSSRFKTLADECLLVLLKPSFVLLQSQTKQATEEYEGKLLETTPQLNHFREFLTVPTLLSLT